MKKAIGCLVILITVLFLPSAGWRFSLKADSHIKTATRLQDAGQSVQSQSGTQDQEITVPIAPNFRVGRVQVLVELQEPPATRVFATVMAASKLPKEQARAAAITASKRQVETNRQRQQTLAATLIGSRFRAEEVYRVQKAYNGISVYVDASHIEAMRALPGVKAVHIVEPEYPSTSTSVPFIGAPQLWANTLGLPAGADGTGMKIGIIDTGIDYQHPNFGGTGLLADYQANNRTVAPDAYFPTAKVVGGTDFCGDAYTGSNTPVPDPDPMDCLGHGTHVAGIAAGLGVQADGSTYPGPYGPSTPFASLRIGPGAAPKALLYALRVFGCGGSTGLTVQAIDWSTDPNGDDDMSDHLDVINMSLGSAFGTPTSTSAVASDNAALVGVIVVASAGNNGDTYFITGSPGSSTRTLSVAASVDSGIPASVLVVNSPAAIAGNYAAAAAAFTPAPPAPSGQTAQVVLAIDPADGAGPLTTDGCSPFTNAAAIAGNIALIDRGTCGFIVKVQNAQAAGAIGAIVVNNAPGDPTLTGMSGTAPPGPAVTIPSVFISQADGNIIKAQLGTGVNATLGAATAADTLAFFSARGPRIGSPFGLKPDIAAPGFNITSAQTGVTCTGGAGSTGCLVPDPSGFKPAGQALTISGTSMAAPHMAGVMALLRQLHPTWTVEELKALAMNGAIHDITIGANGSGLRYGPGRVGAGRVDVPNSALSNVVAFNAEDEGLVNVTFDTEVVGTSTLTKKIKIVNQGTTAATYDLAVDTVVDAPGVAFSLPGGSSVTVQAGQSAEVSVQMSATASLMDHSKDATVAPTQTAPAPLTALGNLARHWLTEEAGYITLKVGGQLKLRVPIYTALRPTSTMSAADTIVTGGAGTGSTTIPLTGADVCTGTLGAGPTCTGTFPTKEVSLVTPFELQVVSPRDTVNSPDFADIQYAGVAFSAASNVLMFGVSMWGDWSTPTDVSVQVYIDNNSDGVYDRVLFNSNPGQMARSLFGNGNADSQDTFITAVFNLATSGVSTQQFVNRISGAGIDSAVFRNNVMFLAATPASLGITGPFKYKIVTGPGFAPLSEALNGFHYDAAAGPYTWNSAAQGLNFGGANLVQDLNGSSLPVTWNTANMTTNGSLGALLLHHFNGQGSRAEVVVLDTAQRADLAITKTSSPVSPALGQNVTFTVTVTNNGPNAATAVVVTDALPVGLTYVSDDGAGAYNSSTGQWTVGSLANGGSATLHVAATLATTDPIVNQAQVTSASPLDANPVNNQAKVTLNAPQSADLSIDVSGPAGPVAPGASVTYTIKVTNIGDDPAYNVVMTEGFPSFPALHASSFTASQGVFTPATNVWNIASIGKGVTDTLTITVTVPPACGGLTCQGVVGSDVTDPVSGNNTDSATTIVTDTTAPTITCPANITKSNDPNQCGAVVTYSAPTVSDGCGVGAPVCSPASGSFFPKGTTTVSCSVSDTSSNTASCSFTVTVNDTQAPTITCSPNINTAAQSSCPPATGAPVSFTTTASDNCPGVTVTCKNQSNQVVTSGSTFPVGTTTVTCTATDTSSNTATCSFTITVFSGCLQDETDPTRVVLYNAQTGQYRFCCGGTVYTGTGTLSVRGCTIAISHTAADRRVQINTDGNTGTASLQSPPGTIKCSITDKNVHNNSCLCQ